MITPEEIENGLTAFIGTESYHRFNALARFMVLTDGAHWLAQNADAFWLMDAIASHQGHLRSELFQVWTLSKTGSRSALLVAEDGNGKQLTRQKILYTDFPLEVIRLYCVQGGGQRVIMLPGEY